MGKSAGESQAVTAFATPIHGQVDLGQVYEEVFEAKNSGQKHDEEMNDANGTQTSRNSILQKDDA